MENRIVRLTPSLMKVDRKKTAAASDAEHISKLRASQSPIAISLQKCPTWSSLEPLQFKGYWDNEVNGILLNTGQTAYFTFETDTKPTLRGGPLIGDYVFEQMHFHWSVDDFTGCEHVLDGHGYAAECHFVHYNRKYHSLEAAVGHPDGLAVVGFLFQVVNAPNPRFDKLIEGLESIKKVEKSVRVSSDSLSWMDSSDLQESSYVTYKGSLTTPPYTECVTWIIYEKPVQIGAEQINLAIGTLIDIIMSHCWTQDFLHGRNFYDLREKHMRTLGHNTTTLAQCGLVGLLRQLEGPDQKPIDRNVRPTQRHPPGHSVIYVKQIKAKL